MRALLALCSLTTSALAQPAVVTKKVKKPDPGLTVGGRVFVRETLESVDGGPTVGSMTLQSARFQVNYELKRIKAQVEGELASGNAKLRDAYLQVRANDYLAVRAGRFKMPASTVESASRWDLPTVDRSFLSDVYDEGLVLARRRIGAMLIGRTRTAWSPKLEVGAFQTLALDGDAQAGTFDQRYGLLGIARGTITPVSGLDLAVWGSSRLQRDGSSAVPSREWATGIDATIDTDARCGPRAWLELATGSSAFDATPMTTARVHFVATRAIVSQRIGTRDKKHGWFIEPFAGFALIDPDLGVASDVVHETTLGINGGQWDRWRLQLQGAVRRAGDGRPTSLAGDADLRDREAFTAQLGAAF